MKKEFAKKEYSKPAHKFPRKDSPVKWDARDDKSHSKRHAKFGDDKRVFRPVRTDRPTRENGGDRPPFKKSTRTEYSPVKRYTPRIESKKLSPPTSHLKPTPDTSWGSVATWYNKHLEGSDDTYHTKVLFPNLFRIMGDVTGKKILDLACGQGKFSELLRDKGALVTGIDAGKALIKIAEENSQSIKEKGTHKVAYHVGSADDLFMIKDATIDIVVCVLALQNIENLKMTVEEVRRVLTKSGRFIFVLNHPSFRNPRVTSWAYNEAEEKQYRRVDEYMSESHVRIDMTPGSAKDKKYTVSFHRPLQVYIKALAKAGFAVTHLEEWISHKESERGPHKGREDKARKEIPLFMCIEGIVVSH